MKSSFLTMMFAILFATSGCAQAQNEQEPSRPPAGNTYDRGEPSEGIFLQRDFLGESGENL